MEQTYFFVDGWSLIDEVRRLWKHPQYSGRRFKALDFVQCVFNRSSVLSRIHDNHYKRVTFYFPNDGDGLNNKIEQWIELPDTSAPDLREDCDIKFCGRKMPKSDKWDDFVSKNVPSEFIERCTKSEKGVDTQICCDAWQLVAVHKMDKLFLMTNDEDFLPLVQSLKLFGVNVYIFRLGGPLSGTHSKRLSAASDGFFTVETRRLDDLFLPVGPGVASAFSIETRDGGTDAG